MKKGKTMAVLEITGDTDRFVLYFQTQKHEVNAYALAAAITGLANAIKAANNVINPGYQVEVLVESLPDGSFQTVIKTVLSSAKNIFASEASKAIIYGVISTYIYEHYIVHKEPVTIEVSGDLVVVQSGNEKIVIPKTVYDAKKYVEKSDKFQSSIGSLFEGALLDPEVKGIGLKNNSDRNPPAIIIPRDYFEIYESRKLEGDNELLEEANLEISRAILSRGLRKWEFFWRGIKISAPVLDSEFCDKFFAHDITIAPGDCLVVDLRIIQKEDSDTGILMNQRYEVVKVKEHKPRLSQRKLKM
jgi:hypothetical protein